MTKNKFYQLLLLFRSLDYSTFSISSALKFICVSSTRLLKNLSGLEPEPQDVMSRMRPITP